MGDSNPPFKNMDKLEQFKKRLDSNLKAEADEIGYGVEPMDFGDFAKKEIKKAYGTIGDKKSSTIIGYENCSKASAPLNSIEAAVTDTRTLITNYENNITRFIQILEKLNNNCIYNMEDHLKEWMTRHEMKAITSGLISDHNRLNDSLGANNTIFELALDQFEQIV